VKDARTFIESEICDPCDRKKQRFLSLGTGRERKDIWASRAVSGEFRADIFCKVETRAFTFDSVIQMHSNFAYRAAIGTVAAARDVTVAQGAFGGTPVHCSKSGMLFTTEDAGCSPPVDEFAYRASTGTVAAARDVSIAQGASGGTPVHC
jgi:hypothetical protein